MSVIEGNFMAHAKGWLPASGVIALLVLTVSAPPEFVLVAAAGILAILALPLAPWFLPVFFGVACGLPILVNENALALGGVKFYGADAILYFLPASVVFLAMDWKGLWADRVSIVRALLTLQAAFFGWGLIVLLYGLFVQDYPANQALGAFRRLFLYPLGLSVALLLPMPRNLPRWLRLAIWAALGLVVLTGMYRLGTGETYQERKFVLDAVNPEPRLLGFNECLTMSMGLAYTTALVWRGRLRRFVGAIAAVVAMMLLVLSGYRLGALLGLAIPFCVLFIMARLQGGRVAGFLVASFVAVFLVFTGLLFFQFAVPDLFDRSIGLLVNRITSFRITDDMRYYTWQAAWGKIAEHPILGTGLGEQLVYPIRASDGQFWMKQSTAHNAVLSLVYQSGLPALALFVAIHGAFITYVARHARRLGAMHQPLLLALCTLYVASFLFAMLQPLQTTSIFCMYLAMGLSVRILQNDVTPEEATRKNAIAFSS